MPKDDPVEEIIEEKPWTPELKKLMQSLQDRDNLSQAQATKLEALETKYNELQASLSKPHPEPEKKEDVEGPVKIPPKPEIIPEPTKLPDKKPAKQKGTSLKFL